MRAAARRDRASDLNKVPAIKLTLLGAISLTDYIHWNTVAVVRKREATRTCSWGRSVRAGWRNTVLVTFELERRCARSSLDARHRCGGNRDSPDPDRRASRVRRRRARLARRSPAAARVDELRVALFASRVRRGGERAGGGAARDEARRCAVQRRRAARRSRTRHDERHHRGPDRRRSSPPRRPVLRGELPQVRPAGPRCRAAAGSAARASTAARSGVYPAKTIRRINAVKRLMGDGLHDRGDPGAVAPVHRPGRDARRERRPSCSARLDERASLPRASTPRPSKRPAPRPRRGAPHGRRPGRAPRRAGASGSPRRGPTGFAGAAPRGAPRTCSNAPALPRGRHARRRRHERSTSTARTRTRRSSPPTAASATMRPTTTRTTSATRTATPRR